ncbi:MAG: TM2 domain-containing protein [Spirochaetaceae bacterium]|jgi:TM2 domain-containing membrane protein YozV|nr:TM2 domain-containing protein [Spirochaetaceae bacterium]
MKSTGISYLLWLFGGVFGLHRFYLGKIGTGLIYLCTGGLAGFGWLYDLFAMPRLVREANAVSGLIYTEGPVYIHQGGGSILGHPKDSVERCMLRLAKNNRGIVSAGELALEANVSMDEAKKHLESMVQKGFAEMRVRSSGTIVYTVPEFMDADAPLEDF